MILLVHSALACQKGEIVEAMWIDGTYMEATIKDVRDGPEGMCGSYRLAWHHTEICEVGRSEYWGDGLDARSFCVVSRESIRRCAQELCRWSGTTAEFQTYSDYKSSGSGSEEEEEDPNRHVAPIAALVICTLLVCCVVARFAVKQCYETHEIDVEKGTPAGTPSGALWAFTPKSTTSSKAAKWIDRTRRAAGPSNKNVKTIVDIQPEPVPLSIENYGKIEKKRVQPEPKGMVQTNGSAREFPNLTALRQAAQVNGKLRVPLPPNALVPPPQNICPPPQLPVLLQHRPGGQIKSPPRKKAPLQGVPPQDPVLVQARTSQTKYGTRNQALGRP